MESRATRDESPTASGILLLDDLYAALLAGGRDESSERRESRMHGILRARSDEVTLTLMLMIPDGDPLHYIMNNALLGMRYNNDTKRPEMGAAEPLHRQIVLQSLRKKCPECEGNKCGRKGKYHDVVYKTSSKPGTASQHRLVTGMGGTLQNNVLCEVDPDTGLFSLPPLEAKKALREWGENVIRPGRRWVNREKKTGDRWKIREVRHFELYANTAINGAVGRDVPAMTAD